MSQKYNSSTKKKTGFLEKMKILSFIYFLAFFSFAIFFHSTKANTIKSQKPCDVCIDNCENCLNNGNFKTNQKPGPYYNCPNYCSTCYIDQNSYLKCDECFVGNFNSNSTCFKCDDKCKRCQHSADNCQNCADGFYFVELSNKCTSLPCPDGYFPEERVLETNKILNNNNLKDNNINLSTDNNIVVASNGNFILNKHNLLCRKCSSKCSKCNSLDKCTECSKGYRKVFIDIISPINENKNNVKADNPNINIIDKSTINTTNIIKSTSNTNSTDIPYKISNSNSTNLTTTKSIPLSKPFVPLGNKSLIQLEVKNLHELKNLLITGNKLLKKLQKINSKKFKMKKNSNTAHERNFAENRIRNKLEMSNENWITNQNRNLNLNTNEMNLSNQNNDQMHLKNMNSKLNSNSYLNSEMENKNKNQFSLKNTLSNFQSDTIKDKQEPEFDCIRDIKCSEGEYYDSNLDRCAKCDLSCKGCIENSKNCFKCADNFAKYEKTNFCVSKANPPKAHYYNSINNSFENCGPNCFECEDKGKCLKCENRFYLDENFSCLACDEKCEICEMNPLNCFVCRDGFLKLENENKCLLECPSEKYFVQEININNDGSNIKDISINNSKINSLDKKPLVNSRFCKKCPKYCASCSSLDKCTSCISGLTFIRETSKCELVCDNGFYAYYENNPYKENDFNCLKCDNSCESCEFDKSYCKKCKLNFFQLDISLTASKFRCYEKCPMGFYLGYKDEITLEFDSDEIEGVPQVDKTNLPIINNTEKNTIGLNTNTTQIQEINSVVNDKINQNEALIKNLSNNDKNYKSVNLIEKNSKNLMKNKNLNLINLECNQSKRYMDTCGVNPYKINDHFDENKGILAKNKINISSIPHKMKKKQHFQSNYKQFIPYNNNNYFAKYVDSNQHLLQTLHHYEDIKRPKSHHPYSNNEILFLQTQVKSLKNYSKKIYTKHQKGKSLKKLDTANKQQKREFLCRSCSKYCDVCEYPGDQCQICQRNYYLLKPEMICIHNCQREKGYFIDKTDNSCNRCDPSCKSCEDSAKNCIICKENFVKFEKNKNSISIKTTEAKEADKNKFFIASPDSNLNYLNENLNLDNSYYIDNMEKINFCIPKSLKISGFFFDPKKNLFSQCHASCLQCENEPKECLKCNSGYFNLIDDVKKSKCFESCPEGYYLNENSNLCEFCDKSCSECFENPDNCLACADGFYKISDTSRCFNISKYEELLGKFIKLYSENPLIRHSNLNIRDQSSSNKKDSKIEIGKINTQNFINNSTMNSSMTNLNGGANLTTLNNSSDASLYFGDDKDQINFNGNDSLVKIEEDINKSVKKEVIIDIKDYFFDRLSNTFKPCAAFCFGCQNSESNCIFCSDGYTRSLIDSTKCIKSCRKGYYMTIFGCMKCSDECAECEGNDKNCLKCNDNYFVLFKNIQSEKQKNFECLESCPKGYFSDYTGKICLPCDKSCNECTGKVDNCLKCNFIDGYLPLEDKMNICVIENPTGYFKNVPENRHMKCPDNCKNCLNKENCIDCINTNYSKFFPFIQKSNFFEITPNLNINPILETIKTLYNLNSTNVLDTNPNLDNVENQIFKNFQFFGNIFTTNLKEKSECLIKCPSGFFSSSYLNIYRNHYETLSEKNKNGNYINKLIRNSYQNPYEDIEQAKTLEKFSLFNTNFYKAIFSNEILYSHYFNLPNQNVEGQSNLLNTKTDFDKKNSIRTLSEILKENYQRYKKQIVDQSVCSKCDFSCSECASTQNTCTLCNYKAGFIPIVKLEEAEYKIYHEKFPKNLIENNCVLETNCPDGFYLYESDSEENNPLNQSISTSNIIHPVNDNLNKTLISDTTKIDHNNANISLNYLSANNSLTDVIGNSSNETTLLTPLNPQSKIQLSSKEGKGLKISNILYNLNLNIDFLEPIKLKKKCDLCSESCMRCSKSKYNCLECNKNYYPLESDRSKCFSICPKGFFFHKFELESICLQCDESCDSCEAASPYCTSCAKGYKHSILDKRICIVEQCQDGFYFDKSTKECLKCNEKCLLCADKSDRCLSCNYLKGFFELEKKMENSYSSYSQMKSISVVDCVNRDALNQEDPKNYLIKGYYLNFETKKFSFCEEKCELCVDTPGNCVKCSNKNGYYKLQLSDRLNKLKSSDTKNLKSLSSLLNNDKLICKNEADLKVYVDNQNAISENKTEDKIYYYLNNRNTLGDSNSNNLVKKNADSISNANVDNSQFQDPFEVDICNEGCIGCSGKADHCLDCNLEKGYTRVIEEIPKINSTNATLTDSINSNTTLNNSNTINNKLNNFYKCQIIKTDILLEGTDTIAIKKIVSPMSNAMIFPKVESVVIPPPPKPQITCDSSCLTCHEDDPKKCIECNNKYKYYPMKDDPSKCLLITPDGYFFDEKTQSYSKCAEGCEKCYKQADYCIGCNTKLDYYPLIDRMNTCTKYCPEGYKFDPNRAICDIENLISLDKLKTKRQTSATHITYNNYQINLFYLFLYLFIYLL